MMVTKTKTQKVQKVCHKTKTTCEDYKNCLEANQLENEMNLLKKWYQSR